MFVVIRIKNSSKILATYKSFHDRLNGIFLDFNKTFIFQFKGKMSKQEMDNAIDWLSSEGHIYSTVDDEHYKVTDED